jgi:hypothetical protein
MLRFARALVLRLRYVIPGHEFGDDALTKADQMRQADSKASSRITPGEVQAWDQSGWTWSWITFRSSGASSLTVVGASVPRGPDYLLVR